MNAPYILTANCYYILSNSNSNLIDKLQANQDGTLELFYWNVIKNQELDKYS